MKKFMFVLAPLVLVLIAELVFRAGAWEWFARPDSHAGTSIRVKNAMEKPQYKKIDFYTVGSSRPVYGLDHEAIAAAAAKHGYVHVNASMPGSHWMTIDVLTDWLARTHPETRTGLIAVETTAFSFAGNGAYELGNAWPFVGIARNPDMTRHVPFSRADPASWAVYSALYQYREDIVDFLRHPVDRYRALRWAHNRPPVEELQQNVTETGDMCAFGPMDATMCDRIETSADPAADKWKVHCKNLREALASRADYSALMRQQPIPAFMAETRDIVQHRLRALKWKRKPLVVLMPVTRAWKDVSPIGQHEWALAVLQPLVDEGAIDLVDMTDALDVGGESDCHDFFDFYHQNAHGRERLMQLLLPRIEALLYDAGTTAAQPAP